jgi:hypothetical protein
MSLERLARRFKTGLLAVRRDRPGRTQRGTLEQSQNSALSSRDRRRHVLSTRLEYLGDFGLCRGSTLNHHLHEFVEILSLSHPF